MDVLGRTSFPGSSNGKGPACNAGDLDSISGSGRPLEKEMGTLSSTLAWRIPWTEEPGGLQSMGCKESDWTEQLTLSLLSGGYQWSHNVCVCVF